MIDIELLPGYGGERGRCFAMSNECVINKGKERKISAPVSVGAICKSKTTPCCRSPSPRPPPPSPHFHFFIASRDGDSLTYYLKHVFHALVCFRSSVHLIHSFGLLIMSFFLRKKAVKGDKKVREIVSGHVLIFP